MEEVLEVRHVAPHAHAEVTVVEIQFVLAFEDRVVGGHPVVDAPVLLGAVKGEGGGTNDEGSGLKV